MVIEAPWTAGGLVFRRAAIRAVEEDAIAGYLRDEEACGYLIGPATEPLVVDEPVRMDNLANRLHALDPEQYFRTARSFFAFNGLELQRAVEAGERDGRPVKVLYHSHLDVGAYFSDTDAAAMSGGTLPEREGEKGTLGPGPAYPLAFLVTSVRRGAAAGEAPIVDEHRLFVWDGQGFVPSSFTIID